VCVGEIGAREQRPDAELDVLLVAWLAEHGRTRESVPATDIKIDHINLGPDSGMASYRLWIRKPIN
jgi:hypothetical protein